MDVVAGSTDTLRNDGKSAAEAYAVHFWFTEPRRRPDAVLGTSHTIPTSLKAHDLEAGIASPILLGLLKPSGRKVRHFSRVTQPRSGSAQTPTQTFPTSTSRLSPPHPKLFRRFRLAKHLWSKGPFPVLLTSVSLVNWSRSGGSPEAPLASDEHADSAADKHRTFSPPSVNVRGVQRRALTAVAGRGPLSFPPLDPGQPLCLTTANRDSTPEGLRPDSCSGHCPNSNPYSLYRERPPSEANTDPLFINSYVMNVLV